MGQASEKTYLCFDLDKQRYGVDVLKTREILQPGEMTPVPQTPPYVLGVINVRDQIIPVVDLKMKLGLAQGEEEKTPCVVVADINNKPLGLLVGEVHEVTAFRAEELSDPPQYHAQQGQLIAAMGKKEDEITVILDIERAFADDQVHNLQGLEQSMESSKKAA